MILNLSHGITSLFLEITKLVGNHLQEKRQNPFPQIFKKASDNRKRYGTIVFSYRCPQISYECHIFCGLGYLWENHDEGMSDLDVHLAIWRMFMKTTLQALNSLGKECEEISFGSKKIFICRQITDSDTSDLQYYTRTTNLEKLFGDVKSQICELSEILGPRTPEIMGLKLVEYGDFAWWSMSLLSERAERIITVKVYVFSDSILCQGEINNPSTANQAWRKNWMVLEDQFLKQLNGISMVERRNWYGGSFQDSQPWRSWRDSKVFEKHTVWTSRIRRTNPLCVDDSWNRVETRWRKMFSQLYSSLKVCSQILRGYWTRKDVVQNLYWKIKRWMGRNRGINDSSIGYRISSLIFRASSAFERGELEIRNTVRNLLDSATMTETWNCFSAQ